MPDKYVHRYTLIHTSLYQWVDVQETTFRALLIHISVYQDVFVNVLVRHVLLCTVAVLGVSGLY